MHNMKKLIGNTMTCQTQSAVIRKSSWIVDGIFILTFLRTEILDPTTNGCLATFGRSQQTAAELADFDPGSITRDEERWK
jgi:hypothetical protein